MSPQPDQKPPNFDGSFGFLLLGLLCTVTVAFRQGRSSGQGGTDFLGILFFVGIGAALAWSQWCKYRMRRLHPGEPWLWEKSWQSGRLYYSNMIQTAAITIVAAVYNLILGVALIASGRAILSTEPNLRYLALAACLAATLFGLGLILETIKLWRRRARYGDAIFEMTHVPGEIGGALSGTITLSSRRRQDMKLHLVLSCNLSINDTEKVLWKDSCPVSLPADSGAARIQVCFLIPRECESTRDPDITWRLELKENPGDEDPIARFDVPVYY